MLSEELKAFRRLGIRHVCRLRATPPLASSPPLAAPTSTQLCIRHCVGAYDVEGSGGDHQHRVADCRGLEVRAYFLH